MSFGSNGVDWVLRKILTRLHGTNFCTTSASFAPSFIRQPNGPKCIQRHQFGTFCTVFCKATELSQMHQNSMKRYETWVLGPMGWIGCVHCEKFWHDFMARTFAPLRPVLTQFCTATKRSQMHPKSTKHTKTWVYRPMGWIGCVHYEKFRLDFVAWTFAPGWPILHWVL